MKKIISMFSLALAACALCPSCTNLESEMYDTINPGIFPTNEADATALVTAAAYAPFRSAWYDGLFTSAQGGIHVVSDMTTDIGSCQWDDSVWPDMLQVNFTSHSTEIATLYSDQINAISKMTLTLERIAGIQMDEDVKARLEAELHLGRGWLAYLLYDMYGPIQIASLEMLNNPLSDAVVPRMSQEDMVKYIEDEINAALPALPAKYSISDSNYGRFTRALGYMVLMKLYMHEKDWAKAIECGRELQKGEYGLIIIRTSLPWRTKVTRRPFGPRCVTVRTMRRCGWLMSCPVLIPRQIPTSKSGVAIVCCGISTIRLTPQTSAWRF